MTIRPDPQKRQIPSVENALHNLAPGATWQVKYSSNDLNDYKIVWLDKSVPQPSQSAIEKEIGRLKSEWEAGEYRRQRVSEYPHIGDQLDALYHAGVFPPDMAKKIASVKKKYPKPKNNKA